MTVCRYTDLSAYFMEYMGRAAEYRFLDENIDCYLVEEVVREGGTYDGLSSVGGGPRWD